MVSHVAGPFHLVGLVHFAQMTRDRALEAINELLQLPGAKKKLIEQWKDFVRADLRVLHTDIYNFDRVSF